jgi:hypothetical protein
VTPATDGTSGLFVLLHAAEDDDYRTELRKHLKPLARAWDTDVWDWTDVPPGSAPGEQVRRRVAAARVVIVLASVHHLPGHRPTDLDRHLEAARQAGVPVVPVIAKPCIWEHGAMADVQPLPRSVEAVSLAKHRDHVWVEVVKEIEKVLQGLPKPPTGSVAAGQAPDEAAAPPPSAAATPPPVSLEPDAPAIPPAFRELADSDDESIRDNVFQQIVRLPRLAEADRAFLRERLDSMPLHHLLGLLRAHGDLGVPASFVDRLAAGLPEGFLRQAVYLQQIGTMDWLPEALSRDGFAALVDRLSPSLEASLARAAWAQVTGCPLFNAISTGERELPPELRREAQEPLRERLLAARTDEDACRRTIEEWLATTGAPDLLRLEWVLSRAEHPAGADLAQKARTRLIDTFDLLEKEGEEGATTGPSLDVAHWFFVRDWASAEGPDRARRMGWLASRVLDFEERDFSLVSLDRHEKLFPEDLRVEIAGLLADRGKAPWWAGDVLLDRLRKSGGSPQAWTAVLDWWKPWDILDCFQNTREHHATRKAILIDAPLPDEPPEGFDERYLACLRDEMRYEEDQVAPARRELCEKAPQVDWEKLSPAQMDDFAHRRVTHLSVSWQMFCERLSPFLTLRTALERLLEKPLSPARATCIARLLKEVPELFGHARIVEVAQLAEPMSLDELPPLKAIDVEFPPQVEAYRLLGGHAADEQLLAYLREHFEKHAEPAQLDRALGSYWRWMEHVVDSALRTELRRRAAELPFDTLWSVARRAPWLADKAVLHTAARRALDTRWEGSFVEHLSADMWPLVNERARRATGDYELSRLLHWLTGHGLSRAGRADILLSRLEAGLVRDWFDPAAQILLEPAAWAREAPRLLRAVVEKGEWQLLAALWLRLLDLVYHSPAAPGASSDPAEPPDAEAIAAFWRSAHAVFAALLLDLAERSMEASDEPRLLAFVDALSQLALPPAESARLRALAPLSERARKRIDAALKLLDSIPHAASAYGLVEATRRVLQALPQAESGGKANDPASGGS